MVANQTTARSSIDWSSLCLAIAEQAPLPMATVEAMSHLVGYVNPAFCRLMDRTREQLVGRSFADMLPEHDDCLTVMDRVCLTGKSESHTEEQHSKSHAVFWSYTIWPVLAGDHPAISGRSGQRRRGQAVRHGQQPAQQVPLLAERHRASLSG